MTSQNLELLEICDKQKAVIRGLTDLGLNNEEIYDCLRTSGVDNYDQYVGRKLDYFNNVISLIDILKFLKYPVTAIRDRETLYYFDYEDGVCWDDALSLLKFSSDYAGQQVATSFEMLINDILTPAINQAIIDGDIAKIEQLVEAITFAIREKQEGNHEQKS